MKIDAMKLARDIIAAEPEEMVPTGEVAPHLLNAIIRPLQRGEEVRFGDVDFDAFELDDLRVAAHYCEEIENVGSRLSGLTDKIAKSTPSATLVRAFC